jgi:hypothetical protein
MCELCCENCFNEKEIVKFIRSSSEVGNCDYCNCKGVHVASVSVAGEFIREGIRREYEPMDAGTGTYYDPEDKEYVIKGQTIQEILIDTKCIFSDELPIETQFRLLEDLLGSSGPYGPKDDIDWIQSDDLVEQSGLYKQESTSEYQSWEMFKIVCKYHSRYFDLLDERYKRNSILKAFTSVFKDMTKILPRGTIMYRARPWEGGEEQQLTDDILLRELSPAPLLNTQNNRMSPVGISYMYLGDDVNTCIREISSKKVHQHYLLGKFKTRKKLKILDMTRIPDIEIPSCFSEEYSVSQKWLTDFIKDFEDEIGQPLEEEEKPLEYVATQVLAEYIRKVGYKGISYKSSYNANKTNYVLFCSVNENILNIGTNHYVLTDKGMLPPFTEWLELLEANIYTVNWVPELNKSIAIDDKSAGYHTIEKEFKQRLREFNKKFQFKSGWKKTKSETEF